MDTKVQPNQSIYSFQFILLCLSSFLFFASFNMIIPELPAYLTRLGGAEYKGVVIALFTLTAGLSRPFSGKLADKIGRVPVMVFGAVVCFVCGFIYPLIGSVAALLVLRLIHGLSTGFTPTGTSSFVADVIPANRRGEAMGIIGLSGSVGMAMGPAIGSQITSFATLNSMFYASSASALLSVLILAGIKETLQAKQRFSWKMLSLSRHEVIEPRVMAPSIVMFLICFSFGTILTITPDFSEYLRIGNKGIFFTIFTLSSLGVRIIAGKVSDKFGRISVLRVSSFLLTLALGLIGLATSSFTFYAGAVLFGISTGMSSPTVSAWTVDLSHAEHRGRAMATMYIAMEAGIGLGALLSSWIYNNNPAMFGFAFWSAGVFSLMAFIYLVTVVKQRVVPAV